MYIVLAIDAVKDAVCRGMVSRGKCRGRKPDRCSKIRTTIPGRQDTCTSHLSNAEVKLNSYYMHPFQWQEVFFYLSWTYRNLRSGKKPELRRKETKYSAGLASKVTSSGDIKINFLNDHIFLPLLTGSGRRRSEEVTKYSNECDRS